MDRFDSPAQLSAFREQLLAGDGGNGVAATLVIPLGACGQASGANEIAAAARDAIAARGLEGRVGLRATGCHGFCQMEPSVLVEPDRTFYPQLAPADVERIVEAAAQGQAIEELLWQDPQTGVRVRRQDDLPFFRGQRRTLLGRHELIDPLEIDSYIAHGGYAGLAATLAQRTPQAVVEEVKASGLRGRGGAGFPTGKKWELLASQPGDRGKFLVCNADEGDPGAYMDRSLLEGNPHAIIEGMAIGAYATGANHGVIFVRNEYPLAIERITRALEQARRRGLLGGRILGAPLSFDIELVRGAGAFVCGEETALIRSIEGAMGEPRQRPPYPIQRGVHGKPTAINNVETWANIPQIVGQGARAFAGTGSPGNAGTKIFSLVGKVRNTGLVEIPMGEPIATIVHDIGGGPSGATPVKAVQTGGPSGGCIPATRFDLPIDYDSLAQAGSIMGSGGMIVMDHETCMVDVARFFLRFLKDESCGKCLVCRKGVQRMYELVDDVANGTATPAHLDLLEEVGQVVKDASMCGLGQTAPNPALSTLRYFRDEYLEHIVNKRCPAGVCKALIQFTINEKCTGCRACVAVCPSNAISGKKKQPHVIEQDKCVKCGACRSVCQFGAVTVA